jgi:hypothetical protein
MTTQQELFIGDLTIRVVPHWELLKHAGPQLWEVMQPFTFQSKYGKVVVPTGFITDFGSVPTFAKPIIDNDDPDIVYGSLPHDWLYRNCGVQTDPPLNLTRYESDCVLYDAMIAAGAPTFKSWLVFRSVRLAGWKPWSRKGVERYGVIRQSRDRSGKGNA